ncbi:MAG: TatD family hydrolase [Bacteroidales bacterium]
MNQFIDTHIHLYDSEFERDLPDVIERAETFGVNRFILPAIDKSNHHKMMGLSRRYPLQAFPAIGLHPTSVKADWEEELSFVFDSINSDKFYAVGEIGMDGYWSKEFINEQSTVFEKQIELAASRSLPVIIHSRDATEEIFKMLERTKHLGLCGVFHAFSGSYETYQRISKMGNFKIGIGGVITFKNSSLAKAAEKMDLKDIILETDAPWLAPVPFRGKRNEPSYISVIAQRLSQIKDCSIEEVADRTTENAVKLFKLKR